MNIQTGMKFVTLHGETDQDENGHERSTPAGSVGTIGAHLGRGVWSLDFDNGASVCLALSELLDPCQYLPA